MITIALQQQKDNIYRFCTRGNLLNFCLPDCIKQTESTAHGKTENRVDVYTAKDITRKTFR